jgi:uncharacterized protein Yka (UPF0111/DUF47 family)
MRAKQVTTETSGTPGPMLADFIARGLSANDRVKYYLALLKAAQTHAQSPDTPASNLRLERESSGIADSALDRIIDASVSRGNNTVYIPGACVILDALFDGLHNMLAAIDAAGVLRTDVRERGSLYRRRLHSLETMRRACKDDQMTNATINELTTVSRNGHDTVNQLIVDLHTELSALEDAVATETIDGAYAYNLTDADNRFVRAFMTGVQETEALKLSHSGLNTVASRDGERLSIHVDCGSTPAHVVVIHVEHLVATINYTDVHRARLRFFQGLLDSYALTWAPAPEEGKLEASVGKYVADTPAHIEQFLRFLGSRLVFLIDWNRARKRLARLVSKRGAIELLRWAADNNVGHRGFLEAGDVALVETAFDRAVPLQTRFGVRLDELLGAQSARLFLMFVLRATSWGMSTGQSLRLIEDKVEAELLRYLETPDRHVLAGVAQHATMIVALAERINQELTRRRSSARADAGGNDISRAPELARAWTARADAMLHEERRLMAVRDDAHQLRPLLTEAANAAAALEETAYMLPLMPEDIEAALYSLLETIAERVLATAREYVRGLEEGQDLSRTSDRLDVDNFLMTVDRLTALGRDTNAAKRAFTERLLRGSGDCRELYALTTVADGLERATSALSRCGAIVRDQVLRTRLAR